MKLKALAGVALISYASSTMAVMETTTKTDQLSYSLGVKLAEQIKQFEDINPDALYQGIRDVLEKRELSIAPEIIQQNIKLATAKIEDKRQQLLDQEASDNLQKSEAFLIENSKRPGITSLKSGLQYRVIKESDGVKPALTDRVVVHYEGRLLNGSVFDSSYDRNKPSTFQVNQLIPGWTEALQGMSPGAIWELYVPPSLAYGSKGVPGKVASNEALIFKVELQEISQ